ncbi:MAG: crossover junction endodeoxyribonuclease RuvC [Candidatus Zambryskibacteria bacterium]|nr:crossover junction endodeoxyribonuclease RuvC [Candidatus Zambryskibacteria bacterium]
MNKSNKVLAIDPGFDRVGIAVLEKDEVLYSDCIETSRKLPHAERLLEIGTAVKAVIKKWRPECLAIESLFFNKNITNALKVSEARGVILYEASVARLEIYEYSPQAVKIAVTGYGKADKRQVGEMVRKLVKFSTPSGKDSKVKTLDDELDAIALGITHLASTKRV